MDFMATRHMVAIFTESVGAIFPSGTVSLGAPPQRIEVARIYNALVSPKGRGVRNDCAK
jgi:hypothetical protein